MSKLAKLLLIALTVAFIVSCGHPFEDGFDDWTPAAVATLEAPTLEAPTATVVHVTVTPGLDTPTPIATGDGLLPTATPRTNEAVFICPDELIGQYESESYCFPVRTTGYTPIYDEQYYQVNEFAPNIDLIIEYPCEAGRCYLWQGGGQWVSADAITIVTGE